TSHTAILAGALEIPAVVGVGPSLSDVSGGETVIIDGNHGQVIIDPDEATLKAYREAAERLRQVTQRLQKLHPLRSETKDGVSISIYGNIEFPEEVDHCMERGADGIGLYRTEFLYLGADEEPSEEDHYEAYCQVVRACPGRPVVIRTLDLGADKVPAALSEVMRPIANPALCLRSIRLSLRNLGLFKTQLRAILRAAVLGDVRIMFPLITSLLELRQAKMVLADVVEDLQEQGIPFKRDVPVGMMVEVPAAAILAERFAPEVDFFSVGTNDLIQYTLAADRSDPTVSDLYRAGDPAILTLLKLVVEAGRKYDVLVTVCGQMSSNLPFVPLLIGLGIRQLSVTPHAIPEVKEVIRSLTLSEAQRIARHAEELDVAREVENYLRGEMQRICPDLMV
ncbi:MAG TPA: phosphoenolpyruvate--protein phosphotransferase, partial [Planctomycetaceae bacterium]|nr:phosphoenolpyruvate--protein phosphotransferase [Planctomycetaceae bacterium]